MEKLVEALKQLHQATVDMYTYAHQAHWNVEGILFVQFHGFFKDLYEDTVGAIDPIAENIRKAGGYAQFPTHDALPVETSARDLLLGLEMRNNACVAMAKHLYDIADAVNEQAIANFAADRLDKHQFHAWWIKASLASSSV